MQRLARALTVVTMVLVSTQGGEAFAAIAWPPNTSPAEVNITADSSPGWLPSQAQLTEVRQTTEDFIAAKDAGNSAAAYAFLAEMLRKLQPSAEYAAAVSKFNSQAGSAIERRVVKITWTKDPAQAPAPGVYVALDMVSRFANIERHCGYLILYQPPAGGGFMVTREESNFLDNATARTIEQQHSRADVDKAWSQLSANCPNYSASQLLPEQPASSIGYPSVAAALADLRSRRGVEMSVKDGWTVASDPSGPTIWSFPPKGHPAYPSAVKRQIENRAGGAYVNMNVLCEASKSACDDLVRSFQALNEQMRQSLEGR